MIVRVVSFLRLLLVPVLCFIAVSVALQRAKVPFVVQELRNIRVRYLCLETKEQTPANLQLCREMADAEVPRHFE